MMRTKRLSVSSFVSVSVFLISVSGLGAKGPGSLKTCRKLLVGKDATTPLPKINPLLARPHGQPFDDPRYLFEVKYDGFRGVLYYVRDQYCRIISRNSLLLYQFNDLCTSIAKELSVQSAIFDGEVIAVDSTGRPVFAQIQRRQGPFRYVAFDIMWLNGQDLRSLPLKSRRQKLHEVLPKSSPFITEALGEIGDGVKMFNLMVENDLEGVVAKRLADKYIRSTRWYKIKNKDYSQSSTRRRFLK